jgi:hypothetical protein
VAEKDEERFVVYDGIEEKGRRVKWDSSLTDINGKLAYVAWEDGNEFVVYGGNEGKRHGSVGNLIDVDGKLVYAASEVDKQFVVMER